MQVLVTGGAGFIGSHITDRLLADGHRVRVLDDLSTGKIENLPMHDELEFLAGDVADLATVQEAVTGCDWVFHEAAIASVPKTVKDPLGSHRVNYVGTLNILEAARQAKVQRVILASSAAVYGDLPELPKNETMPVKPMSPYAIDKLASEYICQNYTSLYGLETVCLRYFNVYGPRQDPSSPYSGVISLFADCLAEGRRPTIYGDGEQTRDFVFVSDVVEANIKAASTSSAAGQVFNIATGKAISINALLQTMAEVRGTTVKPSYKKTRSGDVRHSVADISAARNVLDWMPKVGLAVGLGELP